MKLTDNWKDGTLYCAVINTTHGKFTRVFSFDAHLTEEDCSKILAHSLPDVISIDSFDDWGPVLTLKTKQAPSPNFIEEIEIRFLTLTESDDINKADQLRDLISEMEIAYADTIFDDTLDNQHSSENILYTKIKDARDTALSEEKS